MGQRGGAAIDATEFQDDDYGPTDEPRKLTTKPARRSSTSGSRSPGSDGDPRRPGAGDRARRPSSSGGAAPRRGRAGSMVSVEMGDPGEEGSPEAGSGICSPVDGEDGGGGEDGGEQSSGRGHRGPSIVDSVAHSFSHLMASPEEERRSHRSEADGDRSRPVRRLDGGEIPPDGGTGEEKVGLCRRRRDADENTRRGARRVRRSASGRCGSRRGGGGKTMIARTRPTTIGDPLVQDQLLHNTS